MLPAFRSGRAFRNGTVGWTTPTSIDDKRTLGLWEDGYKSEIPPAIEGHLARIIPFGWHPASSVEQYVAAFGTGPNPRASRRLRYSRLRGEEALGFLELHRWNHCFARRCGSLSILRGGIDWRHPRSRQADRADIRQIGRFADAGGVPSGSSLAGNRARAAGQVTTKQSALQTRHQTTATGFRPERS